MATEGQEELQVRFVTKQEQYAVPDTLNAIQGNFKTSNLNTVINGLLKECNPSFGKEVQFDFLVCGELLCSTLSEHLKKKEVSVEGTLEVEYLKRFPAPRPKDCLMHDDWISSVHTHENWILSGSFDNSIHIWSTKGKSKLAIPGHTLPVKGVSWISFVGDQAAFVSVGHDELVKLWVWDISNNSVNCVVTGWGHDKSVECVSVSADATKLVTGSYDTNICLWSANLSTEDDPPPKKKRKPDSDQNRVMNGSELISREPLATWKGHREGVSSIQWMDFNTVLSSSFDHLLKLWDCELAGIKQEIAGNKAFFDANWSPLNNCIVTGSVDSHIRLYDPRSTESIVKTTFKGHTQWVVAVRWSTTSENHFLSAGYDGLVKLWDTRSPLKPLYDLSGHEDKVMCCDWSNPALLVSGSSDNTVRIFKANNSIE